MSVDGPGILQSDLAHDAYNQILDLYDAGVPVAQIRRRIASFERSLLDDFDREIYLAASAKALWEIGHLDAARSKKLSRLIEQGSSQMLWSQNGAGPFAKARSAALARLLVQISVPRRKPRGRKTYTTIERKLFSVGDCLRLVCGTRIYRGVVCRIIECRGSCEYAMLVLAPSKAMTTATYYGTKIPSSLHEGGFVLAPHVIRPEHRMLVREGNPFEVFAHVELDPTKFTLGSFGGVLDMSHVIEDFERTMNDAEVFGHRLLPLSGLLRAPQDAAVGPS